MRRRASRRRKNRLFKKIFRSGLYLLKAIARASGRFLKFGVSQLLLETLMGISILGFGFLLTSWGIPQNLALYIAIGTVLALLILAAFIYYNLYKSRKSSKTKLKGEAKLAYWIAQTFSHKASQEWVEYQDWLHDILLARRQLIDNKCPRWKVSLITYWRLSVLYVVVGLIKIKQVTARIMKLR